jgi:hypothetical protein
MKLMVIGFLGLLLTGCTQSDPECEYLNKKLYDQYVILDDLPCTFCDKTREEWIRWNSAMDIADDLNARMDKLEGCYYTDPVLR